MVLRMSSFEMLTRVLCGFTLLLTYGQAQILFTGRCPQTTVQSNFDLQRYMGKWFELERYFAVFEFGARCARAEYTLLPDGTVRVNNTATRWISSYDASVGTGRTPDPGEPAKLKVGNWGGKTGSPEGSYWVLETDYDNYSVVYSCDEFLSGTFHTKFAWILGRRLELTPEQTDQVTDVLTRNQVARDLFQKTGHEDCVNYSPMEVPI